MKKRAISEVIGVFILISITIALGALAYLVYMNILYKSVPKGQELRVISVQAKLGGGKLVIVITALNTGTEPLIVTGVKINSQIQNINIEISRGASKTFYLIFDPPVWLKIGDYIQIILYYKSPHGLESSIIKTVKVE